MAATVLKMMSERDDAVAACNEATQVSDLPAAHVDNYYLAGHIHPDDPNPLGMESGTFPRPTYSRAQIEGGMPFVMPKMPMAPPALPWD